MRLSFAQAIDRLETFFIFRDKARFVLSRGLRIDASFWKGNAVLIYERRTMAARVLIKR